MFPTSIKPFKISLCHAIFFRTELELNTCRTQRFIGASTVATDTGRLGLDASAQATTIVTLPPVLPVLSCIDFQATMSVIIPPTTFTPRPGV